MIHISTDDEKLSFSPFDDSSNKHENMAECNAL